MLYWRCAKNAINWFIMNRQRTRALAALFCAMVAAQKGQRSLSEYLRILPVSPEIKSMALQSCELFER